MRLPVVSPRGNRSDSLSYVPLPSGSPLPHRQPPLSHCKSMHTLAYRHITSPDCLAVNAVRAVYVATSVAETENDAGKKKRGYGECVPVKTRLYLPFTLRERHEELRNRNMCLSAEYASGWKRFFVCAGEKDGTVPWPAKCDCADMGTASSHHTFRLHDQGERLCNPRGLAKQ
jgi:hypothetical protein